MKYSVTFYSPDQHISYNLQTLDELGVGGGITARIRTAHALADLGHKVTIYNNCPKNEFMGGVHYLHHSQLERAKADVFVASSSGDGLDLSPLCEANIRARLHILMVHGIHPPKGTDCLPFEYFYSPSNFVRQLLINQWRIDAHQIFVTHRGVKEEFYKSEEADYPHRDPFAILYCGHPSKGLEAAISVLQLLRQEDPRFSLHVYGGYRLWGEAEQPTIEEPGVYYRGLVGQHELSQRMQEYGICINLQSIEDTFGIVNIEAMRAGCIVLASDVGAYPEIIRHGFNGFILEGDHTDEATITRAAQLILELTRNPGYCAFIRWNAIRYPLSWDRIARAWGEHWDWALGQSGTTVDASSLGVCSSCGANWLPFADGLHCAVCGQYQRSLCS